MATIYFNKISVVDHSYIDFEGRSHGGSYNFNFTASLPSTKMDQEQVVVDFSSGKKEVKKIIDQHTKDPQENGWDHKTWIPINSSAIHWRQEDSFGLVETPFLKLKSNLDAFRLVQTKTMSTLEIEFEMEKFVQKTLAPGADNVQYAVVLDEDPYPSVIHLAPFQSTSLFRYEHGLKYSTSYGCKNILHGHLSYVQVGHVDASAASMLSQKIANLLDDSYIYNQKIRNGSVFSYTNERGFFSLEYKFDKKMISLGVEPTIENIFDFVLETMKKTEPELVKGMVFLEISEGLQKGACVINP